jgi:hypothetical protein
LAKPQLMKHPSEQRETLRRLAGDRERDFAPIPREKGVARFFGATNRFAIRLIAEAGHERFRFETDREPKLMWPLVVGHLGTPGLPTFDAVT